MRLDLIVNKCLNHLLNSHLIYYKHEGALSPVDWFNHGLSRALGIWMGGIM